MSIANLNPHDELDRAHLCKFIAQLLEADIPVPTWLHAEAVGTFGIDVSALSEPDIEPDIASNIDQQLELFYQGKQCGSCR